MLGQRDAEHHHDDQNKPQRVPVVCPGALCSFPQLGQTASPREMSVSQNLHIIGASKVTGPVPRFGTCCIVPTAPFSKTSFQKATTCSNRQPAAVEEKPRALARGSSGRRRWDFSAWPPAVAVT